MKKLYAEPSEESELSLNDARTLGCARSRTGRRHSTATLIVILATAVVPSAILYMAEIDSVDLAIGIPLILLSISFPIIFDASLTRLGYRKLHRDFVERVKTSRRMYVSSKEAAEVCDNKTPRHAYIVTLVGYGRRRTRLSVSQELYDDIEKGDRIDLYYSKHAEIPLGFDHLVGAEGARPGYKLFKRIVFRAKHPQLIIPNHNCHL